MRIDKICTFEVTGKATIEVEYKTWIEAEEGEDLATHVEQLLEGVEIELTNISVTDPNITGWRKVTL